jgi:DNA-binding transcriptional LysR family regulator
LNLRFVEAFFWAATLKSVTRAAEKLFITPSALSSRMAALEGEPGVRLLDRRDKQFHLTTAGMRLHRHAERLLNLPRDIEAGFGTGAEGPMLLRIGVNLFVLQGLTGRELPYLARTALPFFGLLVLAVLLIYLFPQVVRWLPGLM